MKILLVDDEKMGLDLMAMILRSEGHAVVAVADGKAALEEFQAAEFDLVMTDFHMPECDGPALARAIKALKPQQKIVLLSGTYNLGTPPDFDYMMHKPVRAKQLTDLIERISAAD